MLKTAGHVNKHLKPCCDLYEDFKNRNGVSATFEEFLKFIEKYATGKDEEGHWLIPNQGDDRDVFRGDMLEILAEIFFKANASSPEVGIANYTPIPLPEDYGVDGRGMNAAGTLVAVQVKYRGNPGNLIQYPEIAKTFTSAVLQQKIPFDKDDCIFVFTSASGVTGSCEIVFGKKLRVINREIIGKYIDNNITFWIGAFNEIKETLLPLNTPPPSTNTP